MPDIIVGSVWYFENDSQWAYTIVRCDGPVVHVLAHSDQQVYKMEIQQLLQDYAPKAPVPVVF